MFTKTLVAESPPPTETTSARADAETARVVAGYELHERLGGGGYGEVWRGTAPGGLSKAVKILHGRRDGAQAEVELRALQKLRDVRHPFLLSIERIEVSESRVVIVTELAEQSLEDRFEQHRRDGLRGVPRDELLAYLKDAADALDFMRQRHGLQHLDVKPGNLLIQSGHVKVGDFGLTKDIAQAEVSIVGGFTPLYAPPELLEGKPHANSDQYSLAIVYQMMLTGSPPFAGRTAAQIAAQHLSSAPDLTSLPACDRPAVARALSKNPRARFKSCREFIDDLSREGGGRLGRAPAEPSQVELREATGSAATDRPRTTLNGQVRQSPARPLPPVRLPGHAANRPTVFLGLGGFGGQVLFGIRQRLAERFGDGRDLPFAFLYLDTDVHAVALARAKEGFSGGDADAVEIPLRTAEEYRRASGRYLDWMSRRWLFNIPKSGEVEGIRPLGRLAFVDHHQKLRDRLHQLISAASHNPSDAAAAPETERPAPDVVLVASIAGGTGGGCVLDAGYLVRDVVKEVGSTGSRVFAVLAGGTASQPGARDPARANGLAFLTELARYDEPGGGFPGDPACRLPKFSGVPFDWTYLVAGAAADQDDVARQAAEYLYRGVATPARAFFEVSRNESSRNGEADGFTLRTFAVATATPATDRHAEADALCRETLDRWLASNGRATDLASEKSAANALLSEAGLTAGQIVARVTARLDGDVGRIIPQIARAAAAGHACLPDALRAVELALDPSRRPEPLCRFEADLTEWADRARELLTVRLCVAAADAAAPETLGVVAAGLAEAERLLGGLLNEVARERAQVERAGLGAPGAQTAEPQGALAAYGTLRVCELAYRFAHQRIADLRHEVQNLAVQAPRVRAALVELRQELADASDAPQPRIAAEVAAAFGAVLQADKALPWSDLADGTLDEFRSRLRTAASRFLDHSGTPAALERPRPLLDNVGGYYRDLLVGHADAAQATPEGVAYVCDPEDGPFLCREVERINLRDAFTALAAGDDWALAAAKRLHVREDVNWPDLG